MRARQDARVTHTHVPCAQCTPTKRLVCSVYVLPTGRTNPCAQCKDKHWLHWPRRPLVDHPEARRVLQARNAWWGSDADSFWRQITKGAARLMVTLRMHNLFSNRIWACMKVRGLNTGGSKAPTIPWAAPLPTCERKTVRYAGQRHGPPFECARLT